MNNSVKKNFIYNSAYQLLLILIPLITTPFISRVLGPEGTGSYSYAYSIASYFVMFIILGLNNYGNRSVARVRDDKELLSKTFFSIFIFQIITGIIVSLIYIIYIFAFSNDTILAWILFIYVISACFDINWFYFGLEQFRITVIRNTIIKISTIVFIFAFVKSKNGVYVYALINVIGMICSQLYLWLLVKKFVIKVKIRKNDVISHIMPNLILFIPVVAISLYKVMDKIMLGIMSSTTQVGYYEACEKVITVPLALVSSLGTVMMPRMTDLYAKNNIKKSGQYIYKSIIFAIFLSTSLSFGIMAITNEFVPFFYGDGFDPCINLFRILLPSGIFVAFANVIRTQYLIPKQKDKSYIISVIAGATTNLILNFILIPKFLAAGAAIGTLCAEFIVCIIQTLSVKNELPIKKYILSTIPYLFSGIIMYFTIYNLNFSIGLFGTIIIKIIIGAIVYFVWLCLFLFIIKIGTKNTMKTAK